MIVKVEILDEKLRKCYGPYKHYEQSKAMIGQQKGLWRIITDKELYDNKEMQPGAYLTKKKFRCGLSFRNLYGESKRK